jgi:hypothetical protein
VYEEATKLDSEVDDKKRHCTNTSQCSVLGTYVDDGLLSAAARYRKMIWKVIRIMFESDEPEEVKRFLGMHVSLISDALQYIVGLGMQEYNENVVRTHEETTGIAVRVCTTTGQSTEGPDPKDLPLVACGRRPRGELGEVGYSGRAGRMDFCVGVSKIARFVERWCIWAGSELVHLLGYMKSTSWYILLIINGGDQWEDVNGSIFSDAGFDTYGARAMTGYIFAYTGKLGTFMPSAWRAWLLSLATTSSGESESVGWSGAAKMGIKMGALKEYTTFSRMKLLGWVDNESLRIAISRGYSAKMSHIDSKYGKAHFYFWQQSGVIPMHIEGTENFADLMTKTLGARRLKYLLRLVYGLAVEKNSSGSVVVKQEKKAHLAKIVRHIFLCDANKSGVAELGENYAAACLCREMAAL